MNSLAIAHAVSDGKYVRCRKACKERAVSCRNRKRLKDSEALSNRAMKKISEKQRIIQDQAKLIKEKEKESITDAPSAKDKVILAAAKKSRAKREGLCRDG